MKNPIDKIKDPAKQAQVAKICKNLQKLRSNGETDQAIEAVLRSLDLPFGILMFITGNYSALMSLKY